MSERFDFSSGAMPYFSCTQMDAPIFFMPTTFRIYKTLRLRPAALLVIATLAVPPPLWAAPPRTATMRVITSVESGLEEELGRALGHQGPAPASTALATKPRESRGGLEEVIVHKAKDYLGQFQYRPMVGDAPVTYTADDATWTRVLGLIDEVLAETTSAPMVGRIRERVLNNAAVLAKLATIYEHAPVMLGATRDVEGQRVSDPAKQAEIVKRLIRQYATDDEVMWVVERALPDVTLPDGQRLYDGLLADPRKFAHAILAHAYVKKVIPEQLQAKAITGILSEFATNGALNEATVTQMLNALRERSPVRGIQLGESTFFQALVDSETLSVIPFLLRAYVRGENNVEIPMDLLPFKPSERLPAEVSDQERARIRAVIELLGLSVTVHSPIVGPQHPKTGFTAILEDAADNVALMKEVVDYAAAIGAKVVVVHISDRDNPEALDRYAEIALHAAGKTAMDGTPLKIGFENYMSKARSDKSRPFPTINEHFQAFAEITRRVARQNPEALRHTALLLDSAHLNLAPNPRVDPLEAAYRVRGLAEALADDNMVLEALERIGLDREAYIRGLVAEVHLNTNIGPILFTIFGIDYGPDIHGDVEDASPIANDIFVALLFHLGFDQMIILAEQKNPLSPAGQLYLEKAAIDRPGDLTVDAVIAEGIRVITRIREETPGLYAQMRAILENPQSETGEPQPWYAYLAGRYGERRLVEHMQQQAYKSALSAYAIRDVGVTKALQLLEGVEMLTFDSGAEIIRQGVTLQEARTAGTARFYLVVDGTVEVKRVVDGQTVTRTIKAGLPFGEGLFLSSEHIRNATVRAGPEGARVIAFAEEAFWLAYSSVEPFRDRITRFYENREAEVRKAAEGWLQMSPQARIAWFFQRSGVPVPADRREVLEKMVTTLAEQHPTDTPLKLLIEVGNNGSAWPLLVATAFPHAEIQVIDIEDTSFKILNILYKVLQNHIPGGLIGKITFVQADGADLTPARGNAANSFDDAGAIEVFTGLRYRNLKDTPISQFLADPQGVPLRLTANLLNLVRQGGTVRVSQGTESVSGPFFDHAELFERVAERLGITVTRLKTISVIHGTDIIFYRIDRKPDDIVDRFVALGLDRAQYEAPALTPATLAGMEESPESEALVNINVLSAGDPYGVHLLRLHKQVLDETASTRDRLMAEAGLHTTDMAEAQRLSRQPGFPEQLVVIQRQYMQVVRQAFEAAYAAELRKLTTFDEEAIARQVKQIADQAYPSTTTPTAQPQRSDAERFEQLLHGVNLGHPTAENTGLEELTAAQVREAIAPLVEQLEGAEKPLTVIERQLAILNEPGTLSDADVQAAMAAIVAAAETVTSRVRTTITSVSSPRLLVLTLSHEVNNALSGLTFVRERDFPKDRAKLPEDVATMRAALLRIRAILQELRTLDHVVVKKLGSVSTIALAASSTVSLTSEETEAKIISQWEAWRRQQVSSPSRTRIVIGPSREADQARLIALLLREELADVRSALASRLALWVPPQSDVAALVTAHREALATLGVVAETDPQALMRRLAGSEAGSARAYVTDAEWEALQSFASDTPSLDRAQGAADLEAIFQTIYRDLLGSVELTPAQKIEAAWLALAIERYYQ